MNSIKKITVVSYDILKGVNATVWGGVEGAKKVSKIITTGLSATDVVVGTSHTLEDLACQDYVCASLDILGIVSTSVGMILGNIPATTPLTVITGSVTVGCRAIRYYCKNYGTYWGCAISGAKFIINKK